MADFSPMSRDEKLLRKLLGQSIETEPPQSRIEFLLQEIIEGGGIGGGSYKIKDQYATLAELEAAHPVGADGDAYLVGDPTHIYIWLDDRQEYADGGLFAAVPGLDGVGITSIEKTSSAGLVDTYTITYTDGNTDTFTVTNGADGEPGEDGVGITSIEKTSTVGLVDTYTITLTDGSTYDFTVTNGSGGSGVPEGGTTGQVLAKKSNADGDVEWVNQSGGSDVSSEIESLSEATSELASETAVLSSETASLTSENSLQASEINSLAIENDSQSSELSSLSQSMSELASAAASTSAAQSEMDSTQTAEINSLASEIDSMSNSDYTSEIASLHTETSQLADVNSTQTSELSSLSQSMSEIASAASSQSTTQSEIDSTQDVSLASLSTENSLQTSELSSLSTASSELASEVTEIGSEMAEKQPMLTEGPGIDIDAQTNEIKTEMVMFTGTKEAYEALSLAEKTSYTHADIINDNQTGIVDAVPTEDSPNLVTSGGVYSALNDSIADFIPTPNYTGRTQIYRKDSVTIDNEEVTISEDGYYRMIVIISDGQAASLAQIRDLDGNPLVSVDGRAFSSESIIPIKANTVLKAYCNSTSSTVVIFKII